MANSGAEDPFERAWRELEGTWDSDGAHRKFIAFCAALGSLGEAGRRYRRVRETDEARAEQARRWSDAVLTSALQGLKSTPREPETSAATRLTRWISLLILVFVVVYGLLALLRRASH